VSDRPERPDAGARVDPCPACGGRLVAIKCKVVCERCRALVENCSGD
jgi:hypothetical protein